MQARNFRIFIPFKSIQSPSSRFRSCPAPLLEEEGYSLILTLATYVSDPLWFNRPMARSTLSPDNSPGNSSQIQWSQLPKKRFETDESDSCRDSSQRIHSGPVHSELYGCP